MIRDVFIFVLMLVFSFSIQATNFEISNDSMQVNGSNYLVLNIENDSKIKSIPIFLEGNAHYLKVQEKFKITCSWGKAQGVQLNMSSSAGDETMQVNEYYYFNDDLDEVFSKSYTTFNQNKFIPPISISHYVCESSGSNKLIEQVISSGPFKVKGMIDTYVKVVMANDLELIVERKNGETKLDAYREELGVLPDVKTLFFMQIDSKVSIVNLIGWDRNDEKTCYRVYAYSVDAYGNFEVNKKISEDNILQGCDSDKTFFKYKNASSIREYISALTIK